MNGIGNRKTRGFFFLVLIIMLLTTLGVLPSESAEMPRAQLDESERYFTRAYLHFLNKDYWDAENYLEQALRVNTYLVDYYLMRGLVMGRLGDYDEGRKALSHFLEVRPLDTSAPRILNYQIAQQRDLQRVVGTAAMPVRWRTTAPDLLNEFRTGPFRPYHVLGLGKARSRGDGFYLTDTLGNAVYQIKESTGGVSRGSIPAPTTVLPVGDGGFHVFTLDGELYSQYVSLGDGNALSLDLRGRVDNTVIDAAFLSLDDIAVADPVERVVAFHSLFGIITGDASADVAAEKWSPPDDEMLFEPVALSAYGPWLAVADRANGKIFIVNVRTKRDFFFVELPRPRDVLWSSLGELLAVDEDGVLSRFSVDFTMMSASKVDVLFEDFSNAWTLFPSSRGDVYCLDITASFLRKSVLVPSADVSLSFMSLSQPVIAYESDKESFWLDATFMSPFSTYALSASQRIVYAVWNNRTIASSAAWIPRAERAGFLLFHRPAPGGLVHPALINKVVENGTDIQTALPNAWDVNRNILTNVIVDSSILFSQKELDMLTLFCLGNGLELDVWARDVPRVELLRASALTGGKTVFSMANLPEIPAPHNKLQIRIPLPPDLSSSGYPGRSMLTVYLDIGFLHARDWIPLWADLLE